SGNVLTLDFVLNAFRHQRFDTFNTEKKFYEVTVLNAFRHQRFDTATAKTLIEFITEANLASTS
ncbi:MAG: hypothetical protein ACK48D_23385, partial [Pseudanabaena sp.]